MPRTNIVEKASKLLADKKVNIVSTKATIVKVQGDTDQYKVIVYANGSTECPCKARTECSHELAASLLVKASRYP